MEKTLKKGGVIIGHREYIWLANCDQQVTHSCDRNLRSQTDKNSVAFNPLTISALYICMLMDIKDTERPERTVLVCHNLAHFYIDVAASSETKLTEQGTIREIRYNYMIF